MTTPKKSQKKLPKRSQKKSQRKSNSKKPRVTQKHITNKKKNGNGKNLGGGGLLTWAKIFLGAYALYFFGQDLSTKDFCLPHLDFPLDFEKVTEESDKDNAKDIISKTKILKTIHDDCEHTFQNEKVRKFSAQALENIENEYKKALEDLNKKREITDIFGEGTKALSIHDLHEIVNEQFLLFHENVQNEKLPDKILKAIKSLLNIK